MSASNKQMANAIRALSMDAVQKANSGHPGMPMGMADIAVALWSPASGLFKHNPTDSKWFDRDRFILSNGHGSMLLYSLLHLTGYKLTMNDIKNFRQLHSKTAGHPEYGFAEGIETTTGPLGQGIANAVGMALTEKLLAQEFNKDGHNIVDHSTFVFLGDGCMMEGVSHEACAFAGTLKLSKLIAVYDDNGISIDGQVDPWFTDDTPKRFESYGWNVIRNVDGHDVAAVKKAIEDAKKNATKDTGPTLICCKTTIGFGSPKFQGTDKVHGAALGAEEVAATRAHIGWEYPAFEVPQDIYDAWDSKTTGEAAQKEWQERFNDYAKKFPKEAKEFTRRMKGELPADFDKAVEAYLKTCAEKAETIASRKASQNAIEAYAPSLPEFLGGSADLTSSNLTNWSTCARLKPGQWGNHISYGVREFGMSAIMNGIILHGGYLPFGATFLTFSDYSRNALRMAALMKIRTLFVFTHDSIGVGEDGPTHQPVEHTASLRLIPNLDVWRPCDTTESAVAWAQSIKRPDGPSTMIYTRQNLQFQKRNATQTKNIAKGGYVLRDVKAAKEKAQIVLIATGSEVDLIVKAADVLAAKGVSTRVVSMPCTNVFNRQTAAYKKSVLGEGVARVAVEAGVTDTWWRYQCAAVIGIERFGESAPAPELFKLFGFTVDNVVNTALSVLQ
jgi:transketolase